MSTNTPQADTGTPTPPEVEKLATQEVRLDQTALIGIFGSSDTLKAMIRLPRGDTQTVTVGDRVAGGTVMAIGEDQLVLSRRGTQKVMRLPTS
ncbi:pilus assembly protein PilZ [Sulfitobacter sp. F26169L]|uniref:pilus assembly protein PilZ n=1 Tax=Sulfitobacter sp. F26169L TaxID=2996015 RepID=UPI002260E3D8|nr:pilus assembly protein PilZ [Sulfitobacter sp. F26169L]MCX7566216.1 pilus assembly protein PilZ [Sulfitobacter sp. F26169L]